MLLKTHAATALAFTYVFDYFLAESNPSYSGNIVARLIVYATSVLLQYLVDQVGHTWKKVGKYRFPARNRLHSLPVMVLMGFSVGLVFRLVTGAELEPVFVSVMLLHWVEDLVTEGGVYLFRGRVRLPLRIRYDNAAVNRLAILLSLFACFTCCDAYTVPFGPVFLSLVVLVSVYVFLTV